MGACSDTTELDEALLTRFNVDYSQMLWSVRPAPGVPLVYA